MTEWIIGKRLCERWNLTPEEVMVELHHDVPLFERCFNPTFFLPGEKVTVGLQEIPAKDYIFGKWLEADAMRRRAEHDKDDKLLRKSETYVWNHLKKCLFRLEDIEALERECPWLNPGATQQPAQEDIEQAARQLQRKIRALWGEAKKGYSSLRDVEESELQKAAINVVEDNPGKWFPITRDHLDRDELYTTELSIAARTFGHNLLRLVMEDQGFEVKNSKKLWEDISRKPRKRP